MSVRQTPKADSGVPAWNLDSAGFETTDMGVSPDDTALAEGNSFSTAALDNPLRRNVCVSIRGSLNDFCLQKHKATWQPSAEALKSIFQQKKFMSLDGSAESQGDLKSVVLHEMRIEHVKSSFPMGLPSRTLAPCSRALTDPPRSAQSTLRQRLEPH